ncbi:MAG: YceI family protein [Gammaproteobacteria bacterium]
MARLMLMRFMIAISLLWISHSTLAATPQWEIIPSESSINFTAKQNGAPVSGRFSAFTGEIQFDQNDLTSSHVKIIVDTNSVTTSFADIAETLKTEEWFDVKLFPTAIFESSNFKKITEDSYQTNGTLTIRDKSLPMSASFTGQSLTPDKGQVIGTMKLQRTQYAVGQGEWASLDEIKDDVQIDFTLTAKRK